MKKKEIHEITILDLTSNDKTKMPDMTYTLGKYFENLLHLDLSYNNIRKIEASLLIRACPHLQKFIIKNNMISKLEEFLPLGKLKDLDELNFLGNPLENIDRRRLMLEFLLLEGSNDKIKANSSKIYSSYYINLKVYEKDKVDEDQLKL